MKPIHRTLFLLVCAVLIGGGLGVLLLALRPTDWQAAARLLEQARMGGGLAGVVLVCAGVMLILMENPARRRDRFLSFPNEAGAVDISTEAIAEYIGRLAPEFPSIVKLLPTVEPRRRRVDIVVDVRIKAGPQLHEICEVLQKRVRESMESGLGIHDVRHVVIRVQQISSEHKTV